VNNNNETLAKNDCPLLTYSESYEDSITIRAVYHQCEADWKFKLEGLIGDKVFYRADSLLEFEFNISSWPKFKRIDLTTFQILLELNDRPFKNKIIKLTVQNGRLIDNQTIPHFETEPKDFDNDGQLEFAGFLEFVEAFDTDTTNYNPVLYFEDLDNGFQLDTQATMTMNIEIWGEFYGFEMRQDIKLLNPTGMEKHLNKG